MPEPPINIETTSKNKRIILVSHWLLCMSWLPRLVNTLGHKTLCNHSFCSSHGDALLLVVRDLYLRTIIIIMDISSPLWYKHEVRRDYIPFSPDTSIKRSKMLCVFFFFRQASSKLCLIKQAFYTEQCTNPLLFHNFEVSLGGSNQSLKNYGFICDAICLTCTVHKALSNEM